MQYLTQIISLTIITVTLRGKKDFAKSNFKILLDINLKIILLKIIKIILLEL